MKRVAILTSHPIECQGPFFRELAKDPEIDLTVLFCWDFGVQQPSLDEDSGILITWDTDILAGYNHKFLRNWTPRAPTSSSFWGLINLGVVWELVTGRYDALIVYGWGHMTNWIAFLAAKLLGIPFFIRGETPQNQEQFRKRGFLNKLTLQLLFKAAAGLLYIGQQNKDFYLQMNMYWYKAGVLGPWYKFLFGAVLSYFAEMDWPTLHGKLHFVPYAVDNAYFQNAKTDYAETRMALGIPVDAKVILFVGKLIPKKRPMDLLYAFRSMTEGGTVEDYHLVFVGDGELREQLKFFANENVHFLGYKRQNEIAEYYNMADAFVLPSGPGETWGLVVNEAMNFALPLVLSETVGCAKNLVVRDVNGYTFPEGDIKALAWFLRNALQCASLLGVNSRAIIDQYSYQNGIEGVKKALNHDVNALA